VKQHPGKWLCGAQCVAAACAIAFTPLASSQAEDDSSPIFGVRVPTGYRQWESIAPSHEAGDFDELRGILGNATAMTAYRKIRYRFPDGAILVKLAWKREPSSEFPGAFVPGHATTVQIMVKDSKRYASTGGWGFGRFIDGRAVDRVQHEPTGIDNEQEGYGRNAGKKLHYYRIAVPMTEIWSDYAGSPRDGLRIEVFETWLERI
jgi:Cytochrome P460